MGELVLLFISILRWKLRFEMTWMLWFLFEVEYGYEVKLRFTLGLEWGGLSFSFSMSLTCSLMLHFRLT